MSYKFFSSPLLKFLHICIVLVFTIMGSANAFAGIVVLGNSKNNNSGLNIPVQNIVQNVKARISRSGIFVHENPNIFRILGFKSNSFQKLTSKQTKELLDIDQSMTFVVINIEADFAQNTNAISYKLTGDVFSLSDASFVSSWSLPLLNFTLSRGCEGRCRDAKIKEEFENGAYTLGDSLSRLLKGSKASSIITPGATLIEFDILDLSESEMIQLVDLMKNEFPGFIDLYQLETYGLRRKFKYRTTSQISKVYEWVQISLMEIGLDIDHDVELILSGKSIFVKKYFQNTNKNNAAPNTSRFN